MTHRNFPLAVLFVLLVSLIVAATAADRGVIKVIPCGQYASGLAWDGKALWLGYTSNTQSMTIDKIDPNDGTVLKSIPEPRPEPQGEIRGLAWDGATLWVYWMRSGSPNDSIFQVDTTNGQVLTALPSPVENYVGGMAWGLGALWISQYYSSNPAYNNVVHRIDPATGNILQTIPTQGEQPMGVAFDGQYIWCAEDTGYGATRQEIYQYDPASGAYTGTFIRNPDNAPRDMTWDGQYLWLVGFYTRQIYQISVSGGTPNIDVPVSSLNFGLTVIQDTTSLNLTISNLGDAPLIISNVSFDTSVFFIDSGQLPIEIPPNSFHLLPVYFSPDAFGTVLGTMIIESNDPLDPQFVVTVRGKGMYAEQTIAATEDSHDFGNVWITQDGTTGWWLGLINQGMQPLEISDLMVNDPAFSMDAPSLPASIAPDDTLLVRVWFTPSAAQVYRDTLRVFSNAVNLSPFPVALLGQGVAGPYQRGFVFWNYATPDNPSGLGFEKSVEGLKSIEDVSGDGIADVIISTENYLTICLNGASANYADTLWVFNTGLSNVNTGSISLNGLFSAQKGLQIASDLNGDGYNDVVIGTDGGNEHVYAINGRTGEQIWAFGDDQNWDQGGFGAVDVQRDFNGDGIPDVVAAASSSSQGAGYKSVYLFDGSNGNILWRYQLPQSGTASAYSAISVADINFDNIPDAVAGYGSDEYANFAVALDGATGFPIWDFVNGVPNGAKELLEVPRPGQTPDVLVCDFWGDMYLLDGETGTQLWHTSIGNAPTQVQRIPDVNGSGVDDIIVSSMTSILYCLEGSTGQVIWTKPTAGFSYDIAAVPDLNGDGLFEVVTGDHSGNLWIYSGAGDSLLYTTNFPGTRVYSVNWIPSIDGNNTADILAGLDDGQVFCLSGGTIVTAISENSVLTPGSFELKQNYPNPFNPGTTIRFYVPSTSPVKIAVFDLLGQKVKTLFSGTAQPGWHQASWDGTDENGRTVMSGVYIYRLKTPQILQSRKMLLFK